MSILNEDIKNTRFILTMLSLGILGLCFAGALGLVLVTSIYNLELNQTLSTLLTTLVGAVIGIVATAYNSYFKDRATEEKAAKSEA